MSEQPARGWNASSHEALLLAMIEEFRPNKEKVTAIVQRMSDLGFNYTFHAVNQHIQKLRKTRDTSALDGSAASGDGSKASTPRKATPRKTPASGRKRKGAVDDDADDLGRDLKVEDEEGATTTPSKRIKSEPASEIRDWRKAAFLLGES